MFHFVLDVVTVVSSSVGIWATVNTTYRCLSSVLFQVGGATVTFSNMKLEAYMPGNDLSPRGPADFFKIHFLSVSQSLSDDFLFLSLLSTQKASVWQIRPPRQLQPPLLQQRHPQPQPRLLQEPLSVALTLWLTATAPLVFWPKWGCSSMSPIFLVHKIR